MGSFKGVRRRMLMVALVLSPGACSDDEPGLSGSGDEGEACYPNDTCNAGLVCDDGRCVADSAAGGEAGSVGSGASGSSATAPGGEGGASTAGTSPGAGSAGEGGGYSVADTGSGGEGGEGGKAPAELRPMPNSVVSGLPNPASYDSSTPGYVLDEVTGLGWQSTVEVISVGTATQAEATTYCANLEQASFTDWRLPSRMELLSIVDYYAQDDPAIDEAAFPATPHSVGWTSTAYPDEPPAVWKVSFVDGWVTWLDVLQTHVRCVRGEPWAVSLSEGSGALTGTVADATTGLTWEQGGSPALRDWAQANTYCVTLELGGSEDWRLPSVNELQTIVDDSKTEDFSFDLFFDDPQLVDANIAYWTSTPSPRSVTQNRTVHFLTGQPSVETKTVPNRVRCVRP